MINSKSVVSHHERIHSGLNSFDGAFLCKRIRLFLFLFIHSLLVFREELGDTNERLHGPNIVHEVCGLPIGRKKSCG